MNGKRLFCALIVCAVIFLSLFSVACMENNSTIPDKVDLSYLSYKELEKLIEDIDSEMETNHVISNEQKKEVLNVVKQETEKYCNKHKLNVSGWAWYDHEYNYTKEWDYYTLKTHLDYKDPNNHGQKAIIYAEVYKQKSYSVVYLKMDENVIIDKRPDVKNKRSPETKSNVNKATNIDLSTYSVLQLQALQSMVDSEIEKDHVVSKSEASIVLSVTKSHLEQYCLGKGIEIKSYAWYDREYTYSKEWDYYWLETHVDYIAKANASQKTDKLFSEVCKLDDEFALVFLRLGDTVIYDRTSELVVSKTKGKPTYKWASKENSKSDTKAAEGKTEKPNQKTDNKPRVILDKSTVELVVGDSQTVQVSFEGLPAGSVSPELKWSTADKAVAVYKNGAIVAVSAGKTVITCKATLADGSIVSSECSVKVTESNKKASQKSNAGSDDKKAEKQTKSNKYMGTTKAKDLYKNVISGESVKNKKSGGDKKWYDRYADVNGISFEVHSKGEDGNVISIEVMDLQKKGKLSVFNKVLEKLFSGDDLTKAKQWLKKNAKKEAQIQIGDAVIRLRLTVYKYPVMLIQDAKYIDGV